LPPHPSGQHEARTRWSTHESGAAFDRKKFPYLTEQAQAFIAQQALCVIAGVGPQSDACGLLVMGYPGFVHIVDKQTCLFPLVGMGASQLVHGLYQTRLRGCLSPVAICFMFHASRQRLCVQGAAEMLAAPPSDLGLSSTQRDEIWIRLHVSQSFFHCPKYIRTHIDGLTACSSPSMWRLEDLVRHQYVSASVCAFLEQQRLCFLCTLSQSGQSAINHRGGKKGFLLTRTPSLFSRGEVLLPDYEGNGAFEAIGNVLETGRAALVVPDYSAQIALCISGRAQVVEMRNLSSSVQQRCPGAKRAIRLKVRQIEGQAGDWSASLAYERERTRLYQLSSTYTHVCLN